MYGVQAAYEVRGQEELNRLLARFRPPELQRRLEGAMARLTAKVLADAAEDAPRDTGLGAESLDAEFWIDEHGVFGRVFSPEIHMLVRELGRRPGQPPPPPGALLPWMSRHPAPGWVMEKYPTEEAREDALRWGIAIHGSPPHPFLRPALLASPPYALEVIIESLMGDML